ncbi:MAG: rod shape-determining protein [Phycisphaeraceae bacterium]
MGKTIGIDLGTTNSCVAVMEAGQPKVLINNSGNRTTPSIVAFTDKGDRLVGQPARQQQVTNPTGTIFSIKRFMGRRHSEVAGEEKMVPYDVTGGSDELVKVSVKDKTYTPQEISAMVLQNLKKTAEDYLGESVDSAVITVPAYFNDSQRQATKEAGEIAGLKVERIINEPTAAAIGSGLPVHEPRGTMIVDIGGGTTEVAIMSLADIAQCESVRVAGDDLDESIISHMKKAYNLMIGEQTAERIKIEIGSAAPDGEERTMEVRGRDMISGLPRKTVITSEEIREALQEPLSAIIETVTRTLERCEPELAADLVDNGIVLAGGGALLRGIDTIISNATGLDSRIAEDPLTCVARGTAIYLEHLEEWKQTMESDMDEM